MYHHVLLRSDCLSALCPRPVRHSFGVPSGGLAYCAHHSGPRQQMWISLAGPLTHIPQAAVWMILQVCGTAGVLYLDIDKLWDAAQVLQLIIFFCCCLLPRSCTCACARSQTHTLAQTHTLSLTHTHTHAYTHTHAMSCTHTRTVVHS
jgi:hypothetical protein